VAKGGPFNPDKGVFTFATGKKGSGKSYLTRRLVDSYPYDRLIIDVTGSIREDFRRERRPFVDLGKDALPLKFPRPVNEGERVTAIYCPDMGSKDAITEADRAIGLALAHGRCLIWIDEIGVVAPVHRTPPNFARVLHHGRHRKLTVMMAGPRPVAVDPLCLAQADHVFVFDLPNPNDRRRVAEEIGWPPQRFDEAVHGLGRHEYLWYNALADEGQGELLHMPALPPVPRAPYDEVPA
jgi:hypothetical protein